MSKFNQKQQTGLSEEIEKILLLESKSKKQKPIKLNPDEQLRHECIISVGYKTDDIGPIVEKVNEMLKENIIIPKNITYGGVYYNELTTGQKLYQQSDYYLESWYKRYSNYKYDIEISEAYVNNDNTCIIVKFRVNGEEVKLIALNIKGLTSGVQKRQIHDTNIYKCVKFDEPVKISLETYADRGFKTRYCKYSSWTLETSHT